MEKKVLTEKEPRVTKALVEYLKEVLPRPDFAPGDTIEKIMYEEGRNSVILFLEDLQERQKAPREYTPEGF